MAVVASRFNEKICERLLDGAIKALREAGVAEHDIVVYRVPGALELPLALQSVANTDTFDAGVALGAVIRGETAHFDYVAGEAYRGISQVMLRTGFPISCGLLTTETEQQAQARAGGEYGNKGFEAGWVALELANLLAKIE